MGQRQTLNLTLSAVLLMTVSCAPAPESPPEPEKPPIGAEAAPRPCTPISAKRPTC
jgi:hypothetical protein